MAISPKIHFDEELYKEALRMGKGNTAMKRWFREPERFADLFNGQIFEGRQIILPDELEPLDSDAGNVHCVENFHSDLQQIFGMLKCRGNKRDLVEYIRKNQWYFRNVDEDIYHVIRELLHSERILKKEVSSANGEECVDMCKALEELYNDGYELGMSKGAIDKSNEIIKNMLNLNVPIETIMQCTGASNEMILELMEKVNI